MYHSLVFIDGTKSRNTWDNWHLIPSSRPVVSRPNPTYKYVDIPGRDGSLDLTEYLVGGPTYSDCSGSFEFLVANDYGDWMDRKTEIASFLDGKKRIRMILEDDPKYYYLGRFYLKTWSPGDNFSTVTIEYRVEPYKYSNDNGKKVIV